MSRIARSHLSGRGSLDRSTNDELFSNVFDSFYPSYRVNIAFRNDSSGICIFLQPILYARENVEFYDL